VDFALGLDGVPKPKPFAISKWAVWEAYRRVKANKGAAGVVEQSLTEFERDLSGNLYKLWNRLSSGSYFPPPVRAVEIPKRDGGSRVLGVPTVKSYRAVVQRAFGFAGGHASVFTRFMASGLRFCMCVVVAPGACMCATAGASVACRCPRMRPIAARSRLSGR
jgi:hypothetical protein